MGDQVRQHSFSDRIFCIATFYESPWERMMTWLWAINWRDGSIHKEVKPGTLRDRLACLCDRFDARWRKRWAARHRNPPERWHRRLPER